MAISLVEGGTGSVSGRYARPAARSTGFLSRAGRRAAPVGPARDRSRATGLDVDVSNGGARASLW
jgi:hypothetical protein